MDHQKLCGGGKARKLGRVYSVMKSSPERDKETAVYHLITESESVMVSDPPPKLRNAGS